MLVMRTIKNPPDEVSGFCGTTYAYLSELVELDYNRLWSVKDSTHVQITSQVERTEPEELVVEEYSDTESRHDEDGYTERSSVPHYVWEHASVAGEDTEALGSDMEYANDSTNNDTKSMDGTGSITDDQEDTRPTKEGCGPAIREDELDIQFVKVITT